MPERPPRALEKPADVERYLAWWKKTMRVDLMAQPRIHYETVVAKLRADFSASQFWTTVGTALTEIDSRYRVIDNYALLMDPAPPPLVIKPYASVLAKALRRNVFANGAWPEPPADGWISPDNWFTRMPDLVRTTFTVKYLDGVEFLAEALRALAGEHGLAVRLDFEARPEGYYAGHLVLSGEYEIPRVNWDTERIAAQFELQITTQLQEVIRKLLHRYYEKRRQALQAPDRPWQWDYDSDEFVANYLGHILHYVEGMIMDVRRKQRD